MFYSIKQFSKMCRTTPRTLRFYAQKGLLKPAKIDTWTKYRYYEERQLFDFSKIKLLQLFNISLKDIPLKLRKKTDYAWLDEELKHMQQEVREQEKKITCLKNFKALVYQNEPLKLSEKVFGLYTLFCWHIKRGEYALINDYRKKIRETAESLGLKYKETDLVFYLSSQFAPKNTPLNIALIITSKKTKTSLPKDCFFQKFPKLKALIYKYSGPHDFIDLTYDKMWYKVADLGFKPEDPKWFDFNLKNEFNTKSVYAYRTFLCYSPIQKNIS